MARHQQTAVGGTLVPPQAIIRTYSREIVGMVNDMIKEYRELLTVYKNKQGQMAMDADTSWLSTDMERRLRRLGNKWYDAFEQFAEDKSKVMVLKVLKNSDLQLKSILKDWLATKRWELIADTIPTPIRQTMKAHVAENVSLIKSIAQQYHERISGAVYRAITGEGSLNQLRRDFTKYSNMSTRRAKLIASDQIHKTFTTLAARRMASVGITRYKWIHGHSHEPRAYHIRPWNGKPAPDGRPNGLNGYIFSLEEPPVIDERTGERGLPARLPFCSCRMAPVFDFE